MEVEEPQQKIENKEQEFQSIFGESDMHSGVGDKTEWDKDHSEADEKSKYTKKCFNKKCQSTTQIHKVKSKVVPSRYRNLCKKCHQNYISNQYCEFCQQIYDNSVLNQEDDHNWMGCDQCDRWNHVNCEYQKRNKNAYIIKQENSPYLCMICATKKATRILSRKQKPAFNEEEYFEYDKPQTKKRTMRQLYNQDKNQEYQNPNPNCINVFSKPKEINLYLDSFLNVINNYKLSISDNEIRQDFKRIKQTSSKESTKRLVIMENE